MLFFRHRRVYTKLLHSCVKLNLAFHRSRSKDSWLLMLLNAGQSANDATTRLRQATATPSIARLRCEHIVLRSPLPRVLLCPIAVCTDVGRVEWACECSSDADEDGAAARLGWSSTSWSTGDEFCVIDCELSELGREAARWSSIEHT